MKAERKKKAIESSTGRLSGLCIHVALHPLCYGATESSSSCNIWGEWYGRWKTMVHDNLLPLIKRWASRWPTSLSEPKTKSALEPWCLTWRKLGASVHYIRLTSACQDCPANKRARSAWSFALSMYRGSTYSLAILKVCELERFFNNYSRYLPWAARRLIYYNTLYRPRRAAFVN